MWCGKQSSLFRPLKTNKQKKSRSFPITGLGRKTDLLKFMKNQQVRYHWLWCGIWIWFLQICSKAFTTCNSVIITINSYTPTCKHWLMIATKSIAQEQTSHWTDLLGFFNLWVLSNLKLLDIVSCSVKVISLWIFCEHQKSEAGESRELVGPEEKY